MNTQSAQDDLAFMKSLVAGDGGARTGRVFGQCYFWAGVLYGGQTLVQTAQAANLITLSGPVTLVFVIGVSAVFLAVLAYITWANRGAAPGGLNSRAIGAVFGATGMANFILIAAIGYRAYVEQSLSVWLLYPTVVFIFQGAAWLVSYMLLRKPWHALIAVGWFACSLGMAATIDTIGYPVIVGIALLLFMALPGYIIMRAPRGDA